MKVDTEVLDTVQFSQEEIDALLEGYQSSVLAPKELVSIRGSRNSPLVRSLELETGCVLIFGDLHLSDRFKGTHVNYSQSSVRIMNRIIEIIKEAKEKHEVVHVIFLGDLFGYRAKNIYLPWFRMAVIRFFRSILSITGYPAKSVMGNHDLSDGISEFLIMEEMGLLMNPSFLDLKTLDGDTKVRFHLVNYGNEFEPLEIAENAYNYALCHNDFAVEGKTASYPSSIDATSLANFRGIDVIISGHIHTPLPAPVEFTITGAKAPTILVVPGSPSRTTERIDEVLYGEITPIPDSGAFNVEFPEFGLWSAEEEFYPQDDEDVILGISEETETAFKNHEELASLLKTSRDFRIAGTAELSEQIKNFPSATDTVKTLALEYYERAFMPKGSG